MSFIRGTVAHLGHSHVPKLDIQPIIQEHIQCLDVTMQDLSRVHVVEAKQDLRGAAMG